MFLSGVFERNPQIDRTGFLPEACRNDKKCKAIYETPHYLRTNKIIAAMPMRYQPKDIGVWLPTRWMKDLTAISAEIKETINPTAKRGYLMPEGMAGFYTGHRRWQQT